MALHEKQCEVCEGEVKPLEPEAVLKLTHELGAGWTVINEHHLEKEFHFKNFNEALAFVNAVGAIAEKQGHHPDIHLSWGKVRLLIWTHSVNGLSENDFILAAKCDQLLPKKK